MKSLDKKKTLLIITKIDTINGLMKKLKKKYNINYFPNASLSQLNRMSKNEKSKISAIFTNPNRSKIKIDKKILRMFFNLDVICTASTGLVHIDTDLCKKKNIHVISLRKDLKVLKNISSTAELAFLLMMLSVREVLLSSKDVKKGNWDCEKFVGRQINKLKIGVIGFGRLGKMFASYASAFKAKVYIYDPYIKNASYYPKYNFTSSLYNLAKKVDIISLHVHVTDETKEIINKKFFSHCSKNVKIINTSRGEVVNEGNLVQFLKKNKNSKYMTDVINNEITSRKQSPIYNMFKNKNFYNQIIITPHIGGMTHDARYLAYHQSVNSLIKYHFNNEK